MKRIAVFAAVAVLALSACGGGDGPGPEPGTAMPGLADCTVPAGETTKGVVCGQCVAADGTTPLSGAQVKLGTPDANVALPLGTIMGKGVEDSTKCVTDSQGDFACLVPAGTTGATDFFIEFEGFDDKTFNANISEGATTDAGKQAMSGDTSAKWAVVPGAYDGVQVLLAQLRGCTLEDGSGNPFDPATMPAEDARGSADCEAKGLLVLSDDFSSPNYPPTFIAAGGLAGYSSLFVNCSANYSYIDGVDAALQTFSTAGGHVYFSDLSDSWLTAAFPGKINFAGNATTEGTLTATVTYLPLASIVGDSIEIVFDEDIWTAIDTVETGVTTFIEGDISTLSSYTGVHPITVGWRPSSASGCVFYTSYHIEGAGAGTGTPQENAIKYLVQNIGSVCQ